MIHQTFEGLEERSHEVCVVGAGPVGLALAVELDRLGLRVLLLESGGRHPDASIQELSAAELVTPGVHDDMSVAVARRLGGTSNLWGARCLKLDPIDFVPRPGLVGARWPITHDELLPYYARACELTCAGAPVFGLPIPDLEASDGSFSFDTLERWANKPKAQLVHGRTLANSSGIDVRLHATVIDLHFTEQGMVQAIDIARSDGSGRRRLPVRTLVLAAGGLESTRLLLAARRQASGRFGGPDGPLGRYYMGHLAGEIADVELASPGLADAFSFFVDGHGSYVRRRFVPSERTQLQERVLNTAMWPVVPPIADPRHGSGFLSLVYLALAYRPLGRRIVAEAIRHRHLPDRPVAIGHHLGNVLLGLPETARLAADFLVRRYACRTRLPGLFVPNRQRRYGLFYHAEQLPNPDSRVTLADGVDRLGLARLRVDLRFQEEDARSVVKVHDLFGRWLEATGVGRLKNRVAPEARVAAVLAKARHGTHQIGTIRMGASPAEGVVDRDLRTFGAPNLFVVGTAVLPRSGQANPTLTAVALAIRLAETLAAEHRLAVPSAAAA